MSEKVDQEQWDAAENWAQTARLTQEFARAFGWKSNGKAWPDGFCLLLFAPDNQDHRGHTVITVVSGAHVLWVDQATAPLALQAALTDVCSLDSGIPVAAKPWLLDLLDAYFKHYPDERSKPN